MNDEILTAGQVADLRRCDTPGADSLFAADPDIRYVLAAKDKAAATIEDFDEVLAGVIEAAIGPGSDTEEYERYSAALTRAERFQARYRQAPPPGQAGPPSGGGHGG